MPVEAPRDSTQKIADDMRWLTERSSAAFGLVSASRETIAKSRELMRRVDEVLANR